MAGTRDLILERLRTYSAIPYDPSTHPDRRTMHDRRATSIAVRVERRGGSERRIRSQHLRYLRARAIGEEVAQYQRWRANASKEMVKMRTALRLGNIAFSTTESYLRKIAKCESKIKQRDEALQRLR